MPDIFDPLFDRVLVKREISALERRTSSANIHLPDQIKEGTKSSEGTVVCCGPECSEEVKALLGKKVLFARYSGDDVKINGEEFVLILDRDIFGALRNE